MTFNAVAWFDNHALSLLEALPDTIWLSIGLPREAGVALVFVTAGLATAAAFWDHAGGLAYVKTLTREAA
jgi:hypothetical protein